MRGEDPNDLGTFFFKTILRIMLMAFCVLAAFFIAHEIDNPSPQSRLWIEVWKMPSSEPRKWQIIGLSGILLLIAVGPLFVGLRHDLFGDKNRD